VKKGEELVSYEESIKKKKQNSNHFLAPFVAAMTTNETNSETIIEKNHLLLLVTELCFL